MHSWFLLSSIISIAAALAEPFSSLRGPLITTNFPDPCVIYDDGVTYAFATNNRKPYPQLIHIQVATSYDNETWNVLDGHDALPLTAGWETGRAVWAPDVKQLPDGRFLMYYADATKIDPATHCVGAAISDDVSGPYQPLLNPLICPIRAGGAIDPAGFLDRSTQRRYIVYKVDGNRLGHGGSCNNDVPPFMSTPLMLQEVNAEDGITLIGRPKQILDRVPTDGPLIEAPAMFRSKEGIYFLFFSANCFKSGTYHTTYATATEITGPYERASRPLFIKGDGLNTDGPGHMDIVHHSYASMNTSYEDENGRLILFHGIMNEHNNPNMVHQYPLKDRHLPFIRGMYSGKAYFRGRDVSLHESGFDGL